MSDYATYPSLNGKTVLLTGGAGGIGAETVRAFAEQGAKVGFVDLDAAAGQALIDELGADHAFERCDLRDIDALQAAFSALVGKLGNADILVNNAAHDDRHDWRDVTPEYWDERMATNLRHIFFYHSSRRACDDRGGPRVDHQHRFEFVVGSRGRISSLCDGQIGGPRPDPHDGA